MKTPENDNRERYICGDCDLIFYENPKIVAGAILEWQGRILLCKRAIKPRAGFWTYPGGFMENGESVVEAAARESWEETGAKSDDLQLHSVCALKRSNQVYMVYRGELKDGQASPGLESSAIGLYEESEIPWDQLAFPVIYQTLKLFLTDRQRGEYQVHQAESDSHFGD